MWMKTARYLLQSRTGKHKVTAVWNNGANNAKHKIVDTLKWLAKSDIAVVV